MRPAAKTHYLPGNHKVWTPPVVIYLDTETKDVGTADREVLALDVWCARLVERKPREGMLPVTVNGSGRDAGQLAGWLDLVTQGFNTVWLYCHNLGFDIATTRLPLVLAGAGWGITDAAVSGSAPWLRMVKGKRHLTVVDSFSWLPHELAVLSAAVGIPKPALPPDDAPAAVKLARCRADVRILAAAMGQLMDWWDDNALGNWTISGAGCGWNSMRHIKPIVRPTINPEPAGIASDRLAIHGGRRGAWAIGTRTRGPFLELDFRNAYPTVAAEMAVPSRRMAPFAEMALDNWRVTSEHYGLIAEVELQTDVSRWPMRFNGATFCPTGRFRANLAGPEIRDALRLGSLVAIHAGYLHELQPHLWNWARWCLDVTNGFIPDTPEVARLAAKGWSRSVIGKWATRGYTREAWGPAPTLGWGYEEGIDNATGARGATIDLAGQRFWSYASGDAEQAYPAVLAWIESETRVRLSRVIEAIGERAILQCDTDGLIASERVLGTRASGGHLRAPENLDGPARTKWVLDQIDPIVAPLVLRVKNTHKSVRVLGPQHVEASGTRAFSGLPRLAKETAPDKYTYKSWPKLAWQMANGDVRGYVRPTVDVTVNGPYAPGWVTTSGMVVAPEATVNAAGVSRLMGWSEMTRKPAGVHLGPAQHPVLSELW